MVEGLLAVAPPWPGQLQVGSIAKLTFFFICWSLDLIHDLIGPLQLYEMILQWASILSGWVRFTYCVHNQYTGTVRQIYYEKCN